MGARCAAEVEMLASDCARAAILSAWPRGEEFVCFPEMRGEAGGKVGVLVGYDGGVFGWGQSK